MDVYSAYSVTFFNALLNAVREERYEGRQLRTSQCGVRGSLCKHHTLCLAAQQMTMSMRNIGACPTRIRSGFESLFIPTFVAIAGLLCHALLNMIA